MYTFRNGEGTHAGWAWFNRDGNPNVIEPLVIDDWDGHKDYSFDGWDDNLIDKYLKTKLTADERILYDELIDLASQDRDNIKLWNVLKPLLDSVVLPFEVPVEVR